MILQVGFMKLCPGKLEELKELNKRWDAVEERLGFPAEKRYRCQFGGREAGTVLGLHEWESLAAMEAAYERFMADPEAQALSAEGILESGQWELYWAME